MSATSWTRLRSEVQWNCGWRRSALPGAVALLALALGCAGGPPEPAAEAPAPGPARAALSVDNGLVTNGLVTNGLVTNGLALSGLSSNGLAVNGLSAGGLATDAFTSWFNSNSASYSDMVMTYVVRCAVVDGDGRTWTNPTTGVTYTWAGSLGLTPGWASGLAATTVEQRVITSCLAAHANKYGAHVVLSLLGLDATGTPIPIGTGELATYSRREGCFFGNLFTGEGIYAGSDSAPFAPAQSSLRACALMSQATGSSAECSPMVYVGACSSLCQLDSTGTYYLTCSYGGTSYPALTTRIAPQDVYTCGDGTCQQTESCGTGTTYDSCQSDCGTCP